MSWPPSLLAVPSGPSGISISLSLTFLFTQLLAGGQQVGVGREAGGWGVGGKGAFS